MCRSLNVSSSPDLPSAKPCVKNQMEPVLYFVQYKSIDLNNIVWSSITKFVFSVLFFIQLNKKHPILFLILGSFPDPIYFLIPTKLG